jgi:PAS domain S-box-containing protein
LALLCSLAVIVIAAREVTIKARERSALHAVLDAATELAIVTTDVNGKITVFNEGAARMLGYTANELVRHRSIDQLHDATELADRRVALEVDSDIDAVLQPVRDGSASHDDWTYVHKNGRKLRVSLALTALRHQAGPIIGFLGIAADVTERRSQEQERERLLWLEREITETLLAQNDELVRMDRTKDEFVATVSHEFRTPLTSIKGYLETLIDGDAGTLNERQVGFLRVIERNSGRLLSLVEDLLYAARVDAGGAPVAVISEVHVVEIVNETLDTARPHAAKKSIVLDSQVDDELFVAADPARLAQLFDNLANNALKFTPEGGTVSICAHRRDDYVVISVTDTGIGIPADEQSKLFARFFRARAATEQAIAGTGIGLAIVKEIADAHGATIEVESTPGVGTTFSIVMPTLVRLSVGATP